MAPISVQSSAEATDAEGRTADAVHAANAPAVATESTDAHVDRLPH